MSKKGRRADNERFLYQDGDYWKENNVWYARFPGTTKSVRLEGNQPGDFNETNYHVVENGNGSITIPGIIAKGIWL